MGAHSVKLTAEQIARIEARRKLLGLTRDQLLAKFSACLAGITNVSTSPSTVKMRLDRALNAKMSCPLSDTTKAALARALDWSVVEFEHTIGLAVPDTAVLDSSRLVAIPRSVRQIAHCAAVQLATHQITRGVDLKTDNLLKVYSATHRMFLCLRQLLEELPVDELQREPRLHRIHDTLVLVLNVSLRPHLTTWADRYQQWHEAQMDSPASSKLSAQQLQSKFPARRQLAKDLDAIAARLQQDAETLKQLALGADEAPSSGWREREPA